MAQPVWNPRVAKYFSALSRLTENETIPEVDKNSINQTLARFGSAPIDESKKLLRCIATYVECVCEEITGETPLSPERSEVTLALIGVRGAPLIESNGTRLRRLAGEIQANVPSTELAQQAKQYYLHYLATRRAP